MVLDVGGPVGGVCVEGVEKALLDSGVGGAKGGPLLARVLFLDSR